VRFTHPASAISQKAYRARHHSSDAPTVSPLALLVHRMRTRSPAAERPLPADGAESAQPSAGSPRAQASDETVRARDRVAIARLRMQHRSLSLFLYLLGPGIIVMLAENDGPSMLSYATTGATYGIGFFIPFILVTFAMAFVVQELTARLAIATNCGHARLIYERYGAFWGRFALGDLVVGNALTLVTEFIAICAGAAYFGIAPLVAIAGTFAIVIAACALGRYRLWERLVIGLALGNCIFIPAACFAHADPHAVLGSLGSLGAPPLGAHPGMFLTLCMANIGATVTPWMIFFQQSAVVDKGLTRADLPQARVDTALGAAIAAIAAIATVVAASPLFLHHIDPANLSSGTDFATALRPYLGNIGSSLFALGMVEAGLVAVMTISTSSAYSIGDVSHRGASLNLKFGDGRLFYLTGFFSAACAAAIVLVPGAPLLAITLTVNVIATLLMPPALLFLLLLINDRELVGDLANGWVANVAGIAVIVLVAAAGAAFGLITAFPQLAPR
jgi:Mn2+/Fe2+ NRAMP family transporter